MSPVDPEAAAAFRVAMGLPEGGELELDLAAAARAVAEADRAMTPDAGSVLLVTVALVRACAEGGHTLAAARQALASAIAWPIRTNANLADLAAAAVALAAATCSSSDLDNAETMAREMDLWTASSSPKSSPGRSASPARRPSARGWPPTRG